MCVCLSTRLCNLLLVSGGPHLLLINLQTENQDCKTYIYLWNLQRNLSHTTKNWRLTCYNDCSHNNLVRVIHCSQSIRLWSQTPNPKPLPSSWTAMTSCHSWFPYWLHGAQNSGGTIFPQFRQPTIIQINLHPEFLLYSCKRQEEDSGRDVMVLATRMQYRFTGAAFHKAFTPKKQPNALASWRSLLILKQREKRLAKEAESWESILVEEQAENHSQQLFQSSCCVCPGSSFPVPLNRLFSCTISK